MSFWNQVKTGLNKAASGAEKQAQIARLNMQVSDTRGEIRRKTEELGAAALPLLRSGELSQPSLTGVFQEIVALETKITDLEAQLERVRTGAEAPATADA